MQERGTMDSVEWTRKRNNGTGERGTMETNMQERGTIDLKKVARNFKTEM